MPDVYKDGIGIWRCLTCFRTPPCDHVKPNAPVKETSEMREEFVRFGVTESVHRKMVAVKSKILREDGALFRECEHGKRHPVGNIHIGRVSQDDLRIHASYTDACCAERCCQK